MPPSPSAPQASDRFPGPRREDCPWCGSARLRPPPRPPRAVALDECGECAHVFRNPPPAEDTRAPSRRPHRATARALAGLADPESWLDAGTGHGHFPEAAREFFPYTSFDGLDPTARVERALAEGRVEEAHRGLLTTPGMTDRLRARYDVVSLFHHLAQVPDPRAELRAALAVLRPGGHLVIEAPDPASAHAGLLGLLGLRRPPHPHLLPLPNLEAELRAQDCVITTTARVHHPEGPAATLPGPLRAPLAAATALDRLLAPLTRRTRFANTYRVVARKPGRLPGQAAPGVPADPPT
ncbi:class I SAM-dependent methyltransferase [Streptomyces sp. NPDC058459]|uniref:class I SAM-dependent methyltransferase n=1 Tax=Streptomyces sp. NPDC058459 TaxID=3346508 RepID=UPI00365E5B42